MKVSNTSGSARSLAWRFVLLVGVTSLFADFTHEGARSIVGPHLAVLGASGAVVGIVAGLGEFVGYALRTIKARVRGGRLVVDELTDLREGTELELLPLDSGDWLDEADRAALHEALRESNADVAAGRLVDAKEILRDLRSR